MSRPSDRSRAGSRDALEARAAGVLDRREFLRRTTLTGVALGLGALAPVEASAEQPGGEGAQPRVQRRVPLGRTGLEISDIGFGCNSLSDERLVHEALDRGINYFDTADGYRRGGSEETLGRALEGRRDEALIATKTKCGARTRRAELMQRLESSLRRLRTDRVDVFFNHAVNSLDRLTNDEWSEFVALARQQGKLRFTGMSGHGGRLAECVEHAVERKLFDVYLLAHNFGQDPSFLQRFTADLDFVAVQTRLPAAMEKARARGAGVIAMKTLRGGRLNDLRPYETEGASFAQAALRWTLSRPHTDALVITIDGREQLDEYLVASGWARAHPADAALLERYEQHNGDRQCRYGCSACAAACPAGVEIPEVLRTRMYAVDYDKPELARRDYANLVSGASPCLACSGVPCAGACPFGLDVSRLTQDAGRRFAG